MPQPYLGEIRIFSWGYPPGGWALCDGSTLSISQNTALFSVIGTSFGGNGSSTFMLPDLRGRFPMHAGGGFPVGAAMGEAAHGLTLGEIPAHTHALIAAVGPGTVGTVANGQYLAGFDSGYGTPSPNPADYTNLIADTVSRVGGSAHDNVQPYLCMSFAICTSGIFPSRG